MKATLLHPISRQWPRCFGLLAMIALSGSAIAQKQLAESFAIPIHLAASVHMTDCQNSPGPQITLDGIMELGGMSIELTFSNNRKGTHTYSDSVSVDVVAVTPGAVIEIPKQPVLGGVGGNPFCWVQLMDGVGRAMSDEIFMGRCVQGPFKIEADMEAVVVAVAEFAALDCTNNQGPYITVTGGMGFQDGLTARFIFRNNDNPVGGPHRADRFADVVMIPPGMFLQFPKQPVLGGVGGNPWIWAQFEQADGTSITGNVLLGRCVQLAPGN